MMAKTADRAMLSRLVDAYDRTEEEGRQQEFRIVRGQCTMREGIRTEVITVSAIENVDEELGASS